ncbi:hypothetical protein WN51_00684 [Melipona quadrifasciata]|uniref:Uncharacterized protein n=1 Tax=Melipona quadrifasciata TaxID=166423 RepID=A0A0N0U4Q1_9HYME|nr:hypothetical protein WN51_00684 [Melipona quadrifasciata]
MLGTPLNHGVAMTRDDRSEQDLDSYNEGGHGLRTDKRELGHRVYSEDREMEITRYDNYEQLKDVVLV